MHLKSSSRQSICRFAFTRHEFFLIAFISLSAAIAVAEEKKKEEKKDPPQILVAVPLTAISGATNSIKLRGLRLDNATAVRLAATNAGIQITLKSKGKADVPKPLEAKKLGDTQVEISFVLPAAAPPSSLALIVITPDGESKPHTIPVFAPGSIAKEKESNGGFRQAQALNFGQTIQGEISDGNDVDTFQFSGKAGQTIHAEVHAARLGSPLDATLTLFDARGQIIAVDDDAAGGSDAGLKVKLPRAGVYFLAVQDAHGRGSGAHVYLLNVKAE